jgi:hypothetical protein
VGLLYEAHASLAAIEEAVAIAREARTVFKCNKHLEQAGFNPSEPHTMIKQGEDHNHLLGEEDAPRQSVHVHALLLALPVNPSIPEQVLHPITPHRALQFDDQLQPTPAQSVTHADNCPFDVRHIAPMLIEDSIYDGISQMVRIALVENQSQLIDSSPLSKAGIKILLPRCYLGSAKLEDFEDFIFNILYWLKLNGMLGAASSEWQLMLLGTCLTGEAQEWYMRNVESPTQAIQQWGLEATILGLQRQFLPMLMHRHMAADFDGMHQGNSTVQELYNQMSKLAEQIVHPPDPYTVR